MKLLFQIIFLLLACFTSSALPLEIGTAPKIVVPTNTSIFQKTETISHSEKAKIGLEIPKAFGIGRSSIASLSGSYLQDDYPDLANVLNITSSILAITDLSANGVDILLKANTNPSAAIDIIF